MKSAKDIMTGQPMTIPSTSEIVETTDLFLHSQIHCAPVVDPGGTVIGLLTDVSLVKAALRRYLDPGKHEKVSHHTDILEPAHFVDEAQPVKEVIEVMLKSPTHRVVVLDKQKKIQGIISPKDIIRFVTGEQKKSVDLRAQLEASRNAAQKLAMELEATKVTLDRYQKIFLETPHMMHSVNAEGKILLANKKIHEALGYAPNELIGKSLTDLYPPEMHADAAMGLKQIMESGEFQVTLTEMMRKNGDRIRVDIASSSLRDMNGKFLGTISISRIVDTAALLRALQTVIEVPSGTLIV